MSAETPKPVDIETEFLVIGSGPAGQKAAIQAAKTGVKVALIERERSVGGACVHTGTIPSKSLREQALRRRAAVHASRGPACGINLAPPEPLESMSQSLGDLLAGVGDTVAAHDHYMEAQLHRNGVQLLRGQAQFVDASRVSVRQIDGSKISVSAPRIVIATGSRPRAPASINVDHEHVLDSDSILSLAYLPRSLLVLGGGVIASEYAVMFAALGCQVVQADRGERPLAFVDAEMSAFYLEELRSNGGEFTGRRQIAGCEWDGVSQVHSLFEDGQVIVTDKVLVALGRVANVDGLGLENIGVALTKSGHVSVDACLQTSVTGIYAAGDVIGPPALASAAMEQGRRAACSALGLMAPIEFAARIPSGIYTIPEISMVGMDEAAARTQFGGALVGRARFDEIARGQINGSPRGLLKLIADGAGRRVVGVQIAGDHATELVHVGQLGLAAELDVDAYVDNVFNFPTMAEAYRVAALDIVKQRRIATGNEFVAHAAAEIL